MKTKHILIGLGVLAAAGITIFLVRRNKNGEPKSSASGNRFTENVGGQTIWNANGEEESNMVVTPDEAFQQGVSSHWAKMAKQRYGYDGSFLEVSNVHSLDGDVDDSKICRCNSKSNMAGRVLRVKNIKS